MSNSSYVFETQNHLRIKFYICYVMLLFGIPFSAIDYDSSLLQMCVRLVRFPLMCVPKAFNVKSIGVSVLGRNRLSYEKVCTRSVKQAVSWLN